MPESLLKKRLWHRCFAVNFVNFLRALILKNICGEHLQEKCATKFYDYFFLFNNQYRENPKKISKLETYKACQYIDIPTNIIKETAGIFPSILSNFYDSVEKSNFPLALKIANITPAFEKRETEITRMTTDQLAYVDMCL